MFALDIKNIIINLYNLGYAVQLYGLTMMVISDNCLRFVNNRGNFLFWGKLLLKFLEIFYKFYLIIQDPNIDYLHSTHLKKGGFS